MFLLDCGEGTQQRIRQEHLSFVKIEAVFISHIHGDHCFGLFGLLSTMSLYHRVAPLHIFGPQNLGPIIKFYLSYFGQDLGYEIVFHPITANSPVVIAGIPSSDVSLRSTPPFASLMVPPLTLPRVAWSSEGIPAMTTKNVTVTAFPLNHKMDCYGYRFDEIVTPRRNPWKPRSYAYVSDTAPFPELASYVKDVDLLYHEATYPAGMEDKAQQYYHSTSLQAAQCARDAGARQLIIGHYSSRIKDISSLAGECREIFPESFTVNDGDIFEIPYIREYEKMSSDSTGVDGCADGSI
ncbi:MAG: ribonuclease Z [Bacteroidales bacterium]|nr:ribonuclease Z [Bacteroidales bacterium]